MEKMTAKMLKEILIVNTICLIIALLISLISNIVYGIIGFGISLVPVTVIYQKVKEKYSLG